MFEKIIEKIEEEIGNKSHECLKGFISDDYFTGYCHSANYVIEILQEEESKPFTPESFGFTKTQKGNSFIYIKETDFNIKTISPTMKEYCYGIKEKNKVIEDNSWWGGAITTVKIKNQFQGETILRALRIID